MSEFVVLDKNNKQVVFNSNPTELNITMEDKFGNKFYPKTKAERVLFDDGETFQQKLDSGELKGEKGDQGIQGLQGERGATGPKGADGLTTKISLNGQTYTESGGTITLPELMTPNYVHGLYSNNISGGNFNDYLIGRYNLYNCTNSPIGDESHFLLDVYKHSDDWLTQVAFDVRSNNIYTRSRLANNWSKWCLLKDSNNEFNSYATNTYHNVNIDDINNLKFLHANLFNITGTLPPGFAQGSNHFIYEYKCWGGNNDGYQFLYDIRSHYEYPSIFIRKAGSEFPWKMISYTSTLSLKDEMEQELLALEMEEI